MALCFQGQRILTFGDINNKIREFGGRQVAKSIASSSTITELVIGEPLDSSDAKVVGMIYNAIARNINIFNVTVWTSQVALKQICCLCSRMRHLKKLDISECNNADAAESSEIAAVLRSNRQLEYLRLECEDNSGGTVEGIDGDMAVFGIVQALRFRSSLRKLELANTNLTVVGVIAIGGILQRCLSLSIFEISDTELELDTVVAAALAEGITRILSLTELTISVRSIPMAAGCLILDALSQNRTLEKVKLSKIELGHDGSLSAARLIERDNAMEWLYLAGRETHAYSETVVDLAPIVRALAFNHTLKVMDLWHMRVRTGEIQNMPNTSLCNSSLEKLGFMFCRFEFDEEFVVFFREFFKLTVALKILSFNFCGFDAFVPLCDAVKGLVSLEELDLYGNTSIEDRGASALASLLIDSQTLQRLDLRDSRITENGNRALLDGVRLNYSLIELAGQALTDSQQCELQFYLDRNKGPAHLVGATIPLALWPHALSQAACYWNEAVESLVQGVWDDSSVESEDEAEVIQQGPDMLYFLVRELCGEIFRNVPTSSGSRRRSKRKRSGYRGRRTRRRGG